MNYDQKKAIADKYLMNQAGMEWDSLADINSLHDAETEDDVKALCNDRLAEEGFPFDSLKDD